MDAAAVKYSLERHLTMPGSFRRSEINAMDHVEVVDPLTVKVVLKQPSSPFLAQLTDRAGMIVSPKAAEAAGKDFGLQPVCAGPFSFVERVPQDHITLERFPQYWNADAIKLDRVVYQPIPDSSVRLANLQAGSIELVGAIVPTDVDAVKANPKLRIVSRTPRLPDDRVQPGERAAGEDADRAGCAGAPGVRAVDRPRGAGAGGVQRAVRADGAGGRRGSPFYDAVVKPPARDVAAAKALLKEAGVTLPVAVTLMVPNNPDLRQVGEVIQSMAAEAGFDVQMTATEYASALSAADRGDFEAFLTAWSGRVDPDGNLYSFLHSGGALNDGKYCNPRWTRAGDARAVPDRASAAASTPRCGSSERRTCRSCTCGSRRTSSGCRRR